MRRVLRRSYLIIVGLCSLPGAGPLAVRSQEIPAPAQRYHAVVALDGTGDFRSLQEAISAAPHRSPGQAWVIRVKPGVYQERVYIQRERGYIRLVGDDPALTVLTHHLHANMTDVDGRRLGTFRTPTLYVDGDGFEMENLTVANAAGPVGQALALRVDGDRVRFRRCRFLGWQDTILVNRGRHWFEDCYIEGHVDFIFGGAMAWFERCQIHCLRDGYITAASTPADQPYGLIFRGCWITGEPGVRTYLGRPWRPYAMTVFLNTFMAEVVRPEGWHNWSDPAREKTARYAEFGCFGPGAVATNRVPWARILKPQEAAKLTPKQVLTGLDGWHAAFSEGL
ncbi:MAG: pectinesterase family protein [Verrucomicrobiota bacterium]|nr:pectinesterase family protein [Limisphaera sp.]MDW8381887.1 pectinesterase family protein [Verrucomicrobiota bacterium]